MKQLIYPILLCLILSSCLLSHQRILDHAFVFDAVRLTSINTYYERDGKIYIQGQRVQITQRDPDYLWWNIKGSYSYYWKVVPGSEGEIVYREASLQREYGKTYLHSPKNSEWQQLQPQPSRKYRVNGIQINGFTYKEDEKGQPQLWSTDKEKKLCSRALYALPAGVAALVLVDLPVSVGAWSIAAVGSVIALPATLPQQQTPTPSTPVPVTETGE